MSDRDDPGRDGPPTAGRPPGGRLLEAGPGTPAAAGRPEPPVAPPAPSRTDPSRLPAAPERPGFTRGDSDLERALARRPSSPATATPHGKEGSMPDPKPIQNDPGATMDVNVVGQSPHVFAYRFWAREPDATEWTVIGEGHTADEDPDSFQAGPFPDQTRIAYWVGIGGNPGTDYRAVVTFSQNGAIVHGGVEILSGRTSGQGGAVEEREVVLI